MTVECLEKAKEIQKTLKELRVIKENINQLDLKINLIKEKVNS